jgi:hypothetical protein
VSQLDDGVPAGPHLVTMKEPDEKDEDDDEIVFTDSAWCCNVPNAPDSETTCIIPNINVPNSETELSTWCRLVDEGIYADSAWCCVIPNATDSETTLTHLPVTLNNMNNDHE